MEFENRFTVQAPIEEVWDALLDVERVAPCVPGAKVLDQLGEDAYDLAIKIKIGPITQEYRARMEIIERDPDAHTATMRAKARETRGQGNAEATTRMRLDGDGRSTRAVIDTDLSMTGKAAAMGAGMMGDVAARITDQFAKNLATMLAPESDAASAAPGDGHADGPGPEAAGDDAMPILPLLGEVAGRRLQSPTVLGGSLVVAFLLGFLSGRRGR